ncbi:hypothetical protein SAY87_028416 [Trapa incisa]|uniref:Dof zinc finger protein n=1 Tax=Trapa incisa TaxID=236973 RepID=A0AAN7KTZ1_9MYRT|nr:hypothetical protein SAY87_028416 [Trapa incisa]
MVFSSIPTYLGPPNWQQLQNQLGGSSRSSTQFPPPLPPAPPPPPPPQPQPHGGGTAGTIRAGSMADRARLANIPMPDVPLKCPRCESTNTKFCYFNNYSLTQPRHFCKTCRRYWTRGGALRNVPVGGGFRRNKRSKGGSSKSPASSSDNTGSGSGSARGLTSCVISGGGLDNSAADILALGGTQIPPLRAMSNSLQYLNSDFGLGDQINMNYGLGSGSVGSILSGGGLRLPYVQQFPFVGGSDPFSYEGSIESPGLIGQLRSRTATSGTVTQSASVKMEDPNNQQLNLPRQFPRIQGTDHQFSTNWYTSSTWTAHLPAGFTSSSTSNQP